jgi:hypothetical protein
VLLLIFIVTVIFSTKLKSLIKTQALERRRKKKLAELCRLTENL